MFKKNWFKRAYRTFLQTAIGYITVNIVSVDFTSGKDVLKSTLIGLAVSAIASGISAAMNLHEGDEKSNGN